MPIIDRRTDHIDQGDLMTPELKLAQDKSEKAKDMNVEPGWFYVPMTGTIYKDGLEIIILDIHKGRTWWGRTEIGDTPPMCSSDDAASGLSITGKKCAECDQRLDKPAMASAEERRKKCTTNYTILAMALPELSPILIRATGISASPVQMLLTQMSYNKSALTKEGTIAWERFKIPVSAYEQVTPYGKSWAIKFGVAVPFGDSNFEKQILVQSAIYLGDAKAIQALTGSTTPEPPNLSTSPGTPPTTPPIGQPPSNAPKIRTIEEKSPTTSKPKGETVTIDSKDVKNVTTNDLNI